MATLLDTFEDGDINEWNNSDNLFGITSSVAYNGTYAGEFDSGGFGVYSGKTSLIPDDLSGGKQIDSLTYFWYETSGDSAGYELRLQDSNGNVVAGAGSENPQWKTWDGSNFYAGDGYERWIKFTISFDWGNETYTVSGEDMSTGSTASSPSTAFNNSASDIEKIEIGRFTTNARVYTVFDNFQVSGLTTTINESGIATATATPTVTETTVTTVSESPSVTATVTPSASESVTYPPRTVIWNGDGTDWDSAASETAVVHENTADTIYNDASILQRGYSGSTPMHDSALEGIWLFHEGSGTTLTDFSENNKHGTLNTASWTSDGINGGSALQCNGSEYVNQFAYSSTSLSNWTASAWISVDLWTSTDRHSWMGFDDADSDANISFRTSNTSEKKIELGGGSDIGAHLVYDVGHWVPEEYHFVTFTQNGDTRKLYVDGSEVTSLTSSNFSPIDLDEFHIGANNNGKSPWYGQIAYARVDSQTLSQSQIQDLYDASVTGTLITAGKTV